MLSAMYKNLSNPQTRYEENSFVTGFKAGIIAKICKLIFYRFVASWGLYNETLYGRI
jgi:hypothetical protein